MIDGTCQVAVEFISIRIRAEFISASTGGAQCSPEVRVTPDTKHLESGSVVVRHIEIDVRHGRFRDLERPVQREHDAPLDVVLEYDALVVLR